MAIPGPTKQAQMERLAANLLRLARSERGWTQKQLAEAAGVPVSTVGRIEAGLRQPSMVTVQRILAAADTDLRVHLEPYEDHDDVLDTLDRRRTPKERAVAEAHHERNVATFGHAAPARPQLSALRDAWSPSPDGDRPDWTRLRAFLDHLALAPETIASAIRRDPGRSGSALMDALLAGIADKLADDQGLHRPSWSGSGTRRLDSLWESPGTPSMRKRALGAAPRQLLEHGVAVSADSLWRERAGARG